MKRCDQVIQSVVGPELRPCRLDPGDLPDPGIEPTILESPALASRFFTTEPPGKPFYAIRLSQVHL